MANLVRKTTKSIEHNRYTVAALIISVLVGVFWIAGCESTTSYNNIDINRGGLEQQLALDQAGFTKRAAELNADIEAANKAAVIAYDDLDKQDAIKVQIAEFVGAGVEIGAEVSGINGTAIGGLITAGIMATLATGLKLDNKRKDRVILGDKPKTT